MGPVEEMTSTTRLERDTQVEGLRNLLLVNSMTRTDPDT